MAPKKSFQGGTFEKGGLSICSTSKSVNTPFKHTKIKQNEKRDEPVKLRATSLSTNILQGMIHNFKTHQKVSEPFHFNGIKNAIGLYEHSAEHVISQL